MIISEAILEAWASKNSSGALKADPTRPSVGGIDTHSADLRMGGSWSIVWVCQRIPKKLLSSPMHRTKISQHSGYLPKFESSNNFQEVPVECILERKICVSGGVELRISMCCTSSEHLSWGYVLIRSIRPYVNGFLNNGMQNRRRGGKNANG